MKANCSAPDGLTATDESGYQKNDGIISGLKTTMDYSQNRSTWISLKGKIKDGKLTGLAPGNYYIRYSETENYKASSYASLSINAAPEEHTLTLMDYEGKQVLDTITVQKSNGIFKAVIPDDNIGYALFTKANASVADYCYTHSDGNDIYIELVDDLVLYALEPEIIDKNISVNFTDKKTKSYILDSAFIYEQFEAGDEDIILKSYFSQLINSKMYNGDCGDIKSMSKEDMDAI